MITLLLSIIPLLTIVGSVLIAFFRWQSSNMAQYKEEAKFNAKQSQENANAIVTTISDAIVKLRARAKNKSNKS